MDWIDILSILCSIGGAVLFVYALMLEQQIIAKLKKIKQPHSWQMAMGLTAFFLVGYIVNIVAVVAELHELQMVFGALIFLFGGIFLSLVISISLKTYTAIFAAVEDEVDADMSLNE